MKKKLAICIAVAGLAVTSVQAATTYKWEGGTTGANWTNGANWSVGSVPNDITDHIARFDGNNEWAAINTAASSILRLELGRSSTGTRLDVNSGGSITIDQMRIAARDATDSGTLNIYNGGSVTINGGNHGVGYSGTGTVNLYDGGSFTSTADLIVGRGGTADGYFNMYGGTLGITDLLNIGRTVTGTGSSGTVDISGGTATIGDRIYVGNGGTALLNVSGMADVTAGLLRIKTDFGATATADLSGGTFSVDKIVIGSNGTLNVSSAATLDTYTNISFEATGQLVWEDDQISFIDGLVSAGTISVSDAAGDELKAYDQEWSVDGNLLRADYNGTDTEVWAVIPEPATLGLMGLSGLMLMVFRKLSRT